MFLASADRSQGFNTDQIVTITSVANGTQFNYVFTFTGGQTYTSTSLHDTANEAVSSGLNDLSLETLT